VDGRVIGDRCDDTAEAAYHSMQSMPHSRITMTTMLDKPTIITSDMVAITTTATSSPTHHRHSHQRRWHREERSTVLVFTERAKISK